MYPSGNDYADYEAASYSGTPINVLSVLWQEYLVREGEVVHRKIAQERIANAETSVSCEQQKLPLF